MLWSKRVEPPLGVPGMASHLDLGSSVSEGSRTQVPATTWEQFWWEVPCSWLRPRTALGSKPVSSWLG